MAADDPFQLSGKPVVVGTGLIALDLVLGAGETATRSYAGGSCGNLLIIMSFLGWKSYPVARLNGDRASKHVVRDMKRWGVQTNWATRKPGSNTPIVVQRIKKRQDGEVAHRFSWKCPNCGAWLPGYAAVPAAAVQEITQVVKTPEVFFFDRVSRGAINLAKQYAERGTLIIFEPSGVGDPFLFREALNCAHILKYSEERIYQIEGSRRAGGPFLEVQTLGSEGLRYRQFTRSTRSRRWVKVQALAASEIKDTSGAGDWCCAGMIHRLGADGLNGFRSATNVEILNALQFGQAMAAWNCKFEGARGSMYACGRRVFRTKVRSLLRGKDVAINEKQHGNGGKIATIRCLGPSCDALLGKR